MRVFSHLLVGLLWALHWLPLPLLARIGEGLGLTLQRLARRRRHIVEVNLDLCFPALSEAERARLASAHFRALGRSLIERGIAWWASPARLARLVRVSAAELDSVRAFQAEGRPVVLLAPHFVGLDVGGTRMAMELDSVSIYARQKNPVADRWLYHGRTRFGDQQLLSRSDGARATVKAMKSGRVFYYLPDMDYGRRDSIFVPFFGVPAATITGLSRLTRLAGAVVVPCVTRMLPDRSGYRVELGPAWTDFPSDDIVADTVRMNTWLETVIETMPEQYYWVHRRFKTRPEGEPGVY